MQAVRKNRYVVTQGDFDKAYKIVIKKTQKDYNFYIWISILRKIFFIVITRIVVIWILIILRINQLWHKPI